MIKRTIGFITVALLLLTVMVACRAALGYVDESGTVFTEEGEVVQIRFEADIEEITLCDIDRNILNDEVVEYLRQAYANGYEVIGMGASSARHRYDCFSIFTKKSL